MESQAVVGDDKQLKIAQTTGSNKTTSIATTMDTTSEHLDGTMVGGLHEQLNAIDTPDSVSADEEDNKLASQLQQLTQVGGLTKNKKLFPQKLWDLIHDDKYNFCLRWSDDGQLVYLNRDEFEDSYLKTSENQFHTQKAISFVRQMNMYGFRKVDDCYYENDNFKRNCNHLLKNMIRKHPIKNHHQSQHQHNNHSVFNTNNNLFQTPHSSLPSALPQSTSPVKQQLVANGLTCNSFANSHLANDFNNYDDMLLNSAQAANLQSMYNDRQKELIQVLLSQQHIQQQLLLQQSNTQHPRDLTNIISGNKNPSQHQHLNPKQDSINLDAFYALVSSINSNIYQAQGQNNSTIANDINKLVTNAQQIHSQLVAQQFQQSSSPPVDFHDSEIISSNNSIIMNSLPLKNYLESLVNQSQTSSHNVSSGLTTIQEKLVSNNTIHTGKKFSLNNESIDSCQFGDAIADQKTLIINKSWHNRSSDALVSRSRDYGKSKSMKRSVDSLLLDSNNNSAEARDHGQNQFNKRFKVLDDTTGGEEDNFRRVINKYAKNLVTQVALAMDAQVDTMVIAQASRYTEQFVETLFDTAQVIARHSNCPKLADNGFDDYVYVSQDKKDMKHNKETERSNINLSDLTSALKLLPSKFLNLLH